MLGLGSRDILQRVSFDKKKKLEKVRKSLGEKRFKEGDRMQGGQFGCFTGRVQSGGGEDIKMMGWDCAGPCRPLQGMWILCCMRWKPLRPFGQRRCIVRVLQRVYIYIYTHTYILSLYVYICSIYDMYCTYDMYSIYDMQCMVHMCCHV